MAIDVSWDNPEKTVIRYEFGVQWTMKDLLVATQADDDLMDSVDHKVHMIFDMSATQALPGGIVGSMRSLDAEISDKLGLIVLVGAPAFFEKLTHIFYNIFASSKNGLVAFKTAQSLDEARQMIKEYVIQPSS
jgi:hypothetical protein